MDSRLTALGWAKILARSRRTRAGTTSLLDAEGATLNHLTLETLLGRIGLLGCDHLDEAEATGLATMRILHDLALLNLAVLLKEARDLSFLETRMDTSDEKIGARVDGAIIILGTRIVLDRGAVSD